MKRSKPTFLPRRRSNKSHVQSLFLISAPGIGHRRPSAGCIWGLSPRQVIVILAKVDVIDKAYKAQDMLQINESILGIG